MSSELLPGVVAMHRIAAMLAARRAELAESSLRAIRANIPAYRTNDDPVTAIYATSLTSRRS